jgi:hypothetical protein
MIAWHYTTGSKLPLIRESGVLRPTDAGIEPGEPDPLVFHCSLLGDHFSQGRQREGKLLRIV